MLRQFLQSLASGTKEIKKWNEITENLAKKNNCIFDLFLYFSAIIQKVAFQNIFYQKKSPAQQNHAKQQKSKRPVER